MRPLWEPKHRHHRFRRDAQLFQRRHRRRVNNNTLTQSLSLSFSHTHIHTIAATLVARSLCSYSPSLPHLHSPRSQVAISACLLLMPFLARSLACIALFLCFLSLSLPFSHLSSLSRYRCSSFAASISIDSHLAYTYAYNFANSFIFSTSAFVRSRNSRRSPIELISAVNVANSIASGCQK